MEPRAAARALVDEATTTNERRGLVIAGSKDQGYELLEELCAALPVGIGETTLVGPEDRLRCEHLPQSRARELLGTTRSLVVIDAHAELRPSALGAIVGTVDGGGLLVLLTPELATWPASSDAFDRRLAVEPYDVEDVGNRFRRRLVETLENHRGIGIVNVDSGTVVDDGLTGAEHAPETWSPTVPATPTFPPRAYRACRTPDQVRALEALASLADSGRQAVVLESDRGRGKTSTAGLAAGSFLVGGESVLVTAPERESVDPLFDRARELLGETGHTPTETTNRIEAEAGTLEWRPPPEAASQLAETDVVIVDEAAAIPVDRLQAFLEADRLAFVTTIHGYEGAGRGFSVRFRDRLAASDHAVVEETLSTPIRYAPGDPLEVWSFRALLLDARQAPDQLVADRETGDVTYRTLEPDTLAADESLLREVFGLLVAAHYRTEPDDLARLLDAPNLSVRALVADDTVLSVALLAEEGNVPADVQSAMYQGERIRGHMVPDVLTSQLRDESAGSAAGIRVVRIATHEAARSRGFGSRLLDEIESEFAEIDWLGTGFGATAQLVRFWADNGYRAVATSTTANERSGEHSVVMLKGMQPAGSQLAACHASRLRDRLPTIASTTLATVSPAAVAAIGATLSPGELTLADHEWELVAGAAFGPGRFDVNPGPFRQLVVHWLADGGVDVAERERTLLVRRVLQDHPWETVAADLEYPSAGACMRALGRALQPLVRHYGDEEAAAIVSRLED